MKLSLLSTEWDVSSVHIVLTCCSSLSHRSSGNGDSSIAAQSQHRALKMCMANIL